LEGLEISEVSLEDARSNKDLRIDAEFFAKMPAENTSLRWTTIGEILDSSQYGISIEMNEEEVGFPIYRMNEIEQMLCVQDISKCADVTSLEAKPFILKDRDVLFNRTNSQAFVGRTGLFKSFDSPPRIFASYLVRLTTNQELVLPEYLVAFLNSSRGERDIKRRARISINQSNVNPEEVKSVRLPLLGMSLQHEIKECFDLAHSKLQAANAQIEQAEQTLLKALGLENWRPPEPLTYTRRASEALAAKRIDSDFFAPRVSQLLETLSRDGLTLGDVAPVRHEGFDPTKEKTDSFDYIEIGGLRSDGTCTAEIVPLDEAPSRANQHVRSGDIITSTVRPIRRLSALIQPDQNGYVCSSGFVVLEPKDIASEVLLTYLRLPIFCNLMDLHTSASLYPAISEKDLLKLPIPKIAKEHEAAIIEAVQSAHTARKEAQELLERAKRAVEIAIEQDEPSALKFLKD